MRLCKFLQVFESSVWFLVFGFWCVYASFCRFLKLWIGFGCLVWGFGCVYASFCWFLKLWTVFGVWFFVFGAFMQVLLVFEGLGRFFVFGLWFLVRLRSFCKF